MSIRRLGANRRNALLSTGPKTKEGKERVRFNAVKHGLTAKAPVIPGEDPKAFKALLRIVRRELRPKGFEEEVVVERIADLYAKVGRATRYEHGIVAEQINAAQEDALDEDEEEPTPQLEEARRAALAIPTDNDSMTQLLRYEGVRSRELNKAFDRLRRLQKGRKEACSVDDNENGVPDRG